MRLTRWTRQTGLVPDVQISAIPAYPQNFRSLLTRHALIVKRLSQAARALYEYYFTNDEDRYTVGSGHLCIKDASSHVSLDRASTFSRCVGMWNVMRFEPTSWIGRVVAVGQRRVACRESHPSPAECAAR